jgi:hypothetical protein
MRLRRARWWILATVIFILLFAGAFYGLPLIYFMPCAPSAANVDNGDAQTAGGGCQGR